MRRRSTWLWLWLWFVVSASAAVQGCGDNNAVAPSRVALPPSGPLTVRGTVVDRDGAPVSEAELRVTMSANPADAGDVLSRTRADGAFELAAPVGAFLVAGKPGYSTELVGPVTAFTSKPFDIFLHKLLAVGAVVGGVIPTTWDCGDVFYAHPCQVFVIDVGGPGALTASVEWDGGVSELGLSVARKSPLSEARWESVQGPTPL